jgi:hypothetical protein
MEVLRALKGSEFARMAIDRVTALERSGWNVKSGLVLKKSDVTIKIMTVMGKLMRGYVTHVATALSMTQSSSVMIKITTVMGRSMRGYVTRVATALRKIQSSSVMIKIMTATDK